MQELRQSLQLLLQSGQTLEARMRRGAQVPLPSVPLQDEAQVEPEHSPERQAHEAAERLLLAQRQQDVILDEHRQLNSRLNVRTRNALRR